MVKKPIYKTEEAVERMGGVVKKRTLERWRSLYRNTGVLHGPAFTMIGGIPAYTEEAIQRYLNENTAKDGAA